MSGSNRSYELIDSTFEHIEQTIRGLQNITGTALGGVTGVIGDAVDQYKALMSEVADLRTKTFRETAELEQKIESAESPIAREELQDRLRQVLLEKESKISELEKASGVTPLGEPPLQSFSAKCPYCFAKNIVEILNRIGETKPTACRACGKTFNAHVVAGHRLEVRPCIKSKLVPGIQEDEAKRFLEVTKCRVVPSHLPTLANIVASFHRGQKKKQPEQSPYSLQQEVIAEGHSLSENEISNGAVRNFFKVVRIGNGFTFPAGIVPNFKARYINDLEEQGLIKAFVRGTILMLSKLLVVSEESIEPLSNILLPDDFEGRLELITGVVTSLGLAKND